MIRSSSLPKLAACGRYESAPGDAGEVAQRGTRIDSLMRHLWATAGSIPADAIPDELFAAQWAVSRLVELSAGNQVATNEAACRITVPIIDYTGTMDAVCVKGRWLADLKSGQRRNYREQMAAYALGCMAEHVESEWTTHLLFCDSGEVVSETWTFRSAWVTVQAVVNNVGHAPTPNEYCGWCAHSLICSARVDAQTQALATTQDSFLALMEDPDKVGEFLTRCKILDEFRAEAERRARELLDVGVAVQGWRLQRPRQSEYVEAADVVRAVEAGEIGIVDVAEAFGSLSAKKAREIWSNSGTVFPESLVKTKTGAAPLVATKTK